MPSMRLRPSLQGAISLSAFGGIVLYAAVVHAMCGCFGCMSGGDCTGGFPVHVLYETPPSGLDQHGEFPNAEFRPDDRWNRTATEGFIGSARGVPATVTWGIIDDGTSITGGREGTSPSDLIDMLNRQHGASRTGLVEDAPWFRFFEDSFNRISELSGVTYIYEPNDGGAPIVNTGASQAGVPGQYPDVRIGGHFVGSSDTGNTLAYNYFPDHGDMVIDTDDAAFFNNSFRDYRRLRNTIMHEAGHGLGLSHVESSNSGQLMEPFIQTGFEGPQIDDILALHRNYGDVFEKLNGGNDSGRSPTRIGTFDDDDTWVLGNDGRKSVVERDDADFVSIDGARDVDFFLFNVDVPSIVDVTLFQVGRTYNEGRQNQEQSQLVTSQLNPLELTVLSGVNGSGIITEAEGEVIARLGKEVSSLELDPGRDYYIRVNGTVDNVQLYELRLNFAEIPEPTAVLLLAVAAGCGLTRRRAA
ncbi:MAG: matrixin family metalloprotease [Planctomycetota bacterium]